MFGQLSQEEIDNYEVLVEELNGNELKRLSVKAYPNRNSWNRCEDLLLRLLDGLNDENARFQIEAGLADEGLL